MKDRFYDMVDVCGGKMTLEQLFDEIRLYTHIFKYHHWTIDIYKKGYLYNVTIYVYKHEFDGR